MNYANQKICDYDDDSVNVTVTEHSSRDKVKANGFVFEFVNLSDRFLIV